MIEDDYDNEIIEEFGSLAECTDYYLDVLSSLNEAHNKAILTKREFKKKKKFVMKQYDLNLKVVKTTDSCHRKKTVTAAKKATNKVTYKIDSTLPSSEKIKIEDTKRYRIEDKQDKTISGQMDVEDLNYGDIYEKEEETT